MFSYVPNALNQVTSYTNSSGTTNLTHDADGNLTQQAKGNGGSTYTYDEENRLTRITGVNQTTGVNEHKSEFFYDGQSRKAVSREFTWNSGTGAWVQQSETRRVYDGMDVVQERDGSNAVTANYTRSGNIGGLLARSTSSGHFYYHYDGGGNVMQLTDAAQATVAQYSYDAYGVLISASGLQSGQPYRYSTKEYHSATGLYDYGYRFYSPSLGRWLNRDPLEEAGGINLYGFVENNSVNLEDEYGHVPASKGKPVYGTPAAAATAALENIYPVSNSQGLEWGGWIVKVPGGYRPQKPVQGGPDGINYGPRPPGAAGTFHTHPSTSRDGKIYINERFSTPDIENAETRGVPNYVATPTRIIVYDPATNGQGVIKHR